MLVTVDVEQIDRRITEIKLEIEKLEGQIKNLSFENKGLDSLKAEIERFSVKDDNPTLQEEIFHLLSIHKKLTTLEITEKLPKKNKTSIASTLSRLNKQGYLKRNSRFWMLKHTEEEKENSDHNHFDLLLSANKNKKEAQ
jgi:hypothetical protein